MKLAALAGLGAGVVILGWSAHQSRIAAPTLVPEPTPAVPGAQVFWLHCMPCHGDDGQGLTDEFRMREYPPEDADCWDSGCHGASPYPGGFKLPRVVPAVMGPGALTRFRARSDVAAFVRRAMPYNAPGSLTAAEYDQVVDYVWARSGRAAADPGWIVGAGLLIILGGAWLMTRRR